MAKRKRKPDPEREPESKGNPEPKSKPVQKRKPARKTSASKTRSKPAQKPRSASKSKPARKRKPAPKRSKPGQEPSPKLGHDPFAGADLGWMKEEQRTRQPAAYESSLGDDPLAGLDVAALDAPIPLEIEDAARPEIEVDLPELIQADAPPGTTLTGGVSAPEATFYFPADFRWGVATAAHQVEGNNTNNDWWAWEQEQGRIKQGGVSGRACDWWANAESDFDRAADMGLNSLRLSVEWSRIEPYPGEFDDSVLGRYAEMLHGLRERGIEPMVTLHHFTNPGWLSDRGGWEDSVAIEHFCHFARRVVDVLGRHCDLWCTINEPNVYAHLGYLQGTFPPGRSDPRAATRVARHLLIAHAAAYREIHDVQPHARVGLALQMRVFDPANARSSMDRRAARAVDRGFNGAILTALDRGRWTLPLGLGPAWGLRRSLDWIGLDYATRDLVAFDRTQRPFFARHLHAADAELLDGGYGEFYPHGLFRCLRRLNRLGLPIYVTENGLPDEDDDQRPRYLLTHLHQLWKAIQQCYPVMGYYHWTLVDNFEWAEGWTLRFGLIALDQDTQIRTPRRSASLYADLVRAGAITPQIIDTYAPELREELLPGRRATA